MNPFSLTNPWVILALVLALAGAGLGGWRLGAKNNESGWQKREAQITAESAAKIKASMDRTLAAERKSATDLVAVSAQYQGQLKENEDAKNRVMAELRAGTRRLSIPARCPSGGDGVPAASGSASGRDGPEVSVVLGAAASDFLVNLASEADAVVRQLSACQAVVARDRLLP